MSQFKVDFAIIGISGIDAEDGALLDYDFREVQVSRQIMESARRTWLVADHTKFGRNATVRLCSLADVDVLFTDRPPPENLAALIAGAGGGDRSRPGRAFRIDRGAEAGLAVPRNPRARTRIALAAGTLGRVSSNSKPTAQERAETKSG